MAYSSTDLTNIEAAIASGVLEVVTSDGKKVRYNSLTDLMRARDYVAAQLAPTNRKASVSYVRHRRES